MNNVIYYVIKTQARLAHLATTSDSAGILNMKIDFVFVVVLALVQCVNGKDEPRFPYGDVRNCPTTSPLDPIQSFYQMEVLPGGGFNILRSVDMG